MKLLNYIILFFMTAPLLFAELPDYTAWIGIEPADAFSVFGPPSHIYVHRGETAKEDNVIFYRDGLYLFWFENRVWQVRADKNSEAVIAGIGIGDSRDMVAGVLGKELHAEKDGSLFFEISRGTYPLRLRIAFDSENAVEDIYLYRGDF